MSRRSASSGPEFQHDEENFVMLAANTAEPCVAYRKAFRTATMFVVGYGTEHERVFHRGQAGAANAWASSHGGLTIRKTTASQLCAHIVEAVLNGDYPTPLQEQMDEKSPALEGVEETDELPVVEVEEADDVPVKNERGKAAKVVVGDAERIADGEGFPQLGGDARHTGATDSTLDADARQASER
jgi:hypothetical protein